MQITMDGVSFQDRVDQHLSHIGAQGDRLRRRAARFTALTGIQLFPRIGNVTLLSRFSMDLWRFAGTYLAGVRYKIDHKAGGNSKFFCVNGTALVDIFAELGVPVRATHPVLGMNRNCSGSSRCCWIFPQIRTSS
jgi:hypothetical protein